MNYRNEFRIVLSRCTSTLSKETEVLSTTWQPLCKTEKSRSVRTKCMKQRISNNEISPGRADLVLWRRCDRGFWFVVQTASLASDRRYQSLARTLRAQRVEPHLHVLASRPSPQSIT